jgi:ribokinase
MPPALEHDKYSSIKVIVPGAICTDITVSGVPKLPLVGQDAYGSELTIGAGAKSRNIADMTARLTNKGMVAMLSRTIKDPYGLWRVPYEALKTAGVNVDFVRVISQEESSILPAIALVTVDANGNRYASINNTIIDEFSTADIDWANQVFEAAAHNNGMLVLSLELPIKTALYTMQKAAANNIRILLDPGGLVNLHDSDLLFSQPIYLLKPNEHETKQLTGIEVMNLKTAGQAAEILQRKGVKNVLITHGERGAYLFEDDASRQHIPIPSIKLSGQKDATGCGDQVLAALCAYLSEGYTLTESAKLAIVAGTLQFNRLGIKPVTPEDIMSVVK